MFVAKEYQPSIIYIDEAEKVWPAKKKGKKGKKAKKDPNAPQRIKKTLAKWKGKFIEDNFRVLLKEGVQEVLRQGDLLPLPRLLDAQTHVEDVYRGVGWCPPPRLPSVHPRTHLAWLLGRLPQKECRVSPHQVPQAECKLQLH
jgi:hypothetical protein